MGREEVEGFFLLTFRSRLLVRAERWLAGNSGCERCDFREYATKRRGRNGCSKQLSALKTFHRILRLGKYLRNGGTARR
jgi:hypothetical protein